MLYRFNGLSLDSDRFVLTGKSGETIALQPRALELLLLLVRRAGTMVDKDIIMQEVWGGLHVSRSALPLQVSAIRQALGDSTKPYTSLETVHGKGLRFVADVRVDDGGKGGEWLAEPAPVAQLQAPETEIGETELIGKKPTIAVLPFTEHNKDAGLHGLAVAFPVDIITALSRLRLLRVISRCSSFLLDTQNASPLMAKSAFNADYSVTGSVARAGDKYLISVELAETTHQEVVWAGQFEVAPRDIHNVRADIVSQITAKAESQISRHEARRLTLRQPDSLTAWQAFHVGSSLVYRRGEANMLGARVYFERAVRIDPGFARAWAGLAHTHAFEVIHSPAGEQHAPMRKLLKAAETAIDADPDDPAANLFMGRAVAAAHTTWESEAWFENAVNLSPSYAMAHQQLASFNAFSGNHEAAIEHSSAALRLSPHGPLRFANFAALAIANLGMGDMAKAIEWGRKAGKVTYDDLMIMLTGLYANHLAGDMDAAKRLSTRMKRAFPGATRDDIVKLNREMDDKIAPIADHILETYGFL